MRCYRRIGTANACPRKATMFVGAWGGKSWSGYFCQSHATVIIKLRMKLIKKYNQSVVLRPLSKYDKQRVKQLKKDVNG